MVRDLSDRASTHELGREWVWIAAWVICTLFSNNMAAALPSQELPTLAPMLERVTPAVVNIATKGRMPVQQNPLFNDPFFRFFFGVPDQPHERRTQSLGSGVIVDAERGLVLTNAHVIANADQVTVILGDGRSYEAEIIGKDPETDIAVVKIPSEGLTDLPMAASDELDVGDFVVAIGNPFGLSQTVTSGIVSALGRSGLGIEGYENFIQTDAAINPGNSGGALVDLQGRLVGINTAIFSSSGGNIGIGFAIPINMARHVMQQLVKHGEVRRGYLGIQLQDLNAELAEAFDISRRQGAVIVHVVPDTPAQKAGLQAGDVVVSVNGRPVRDASALRNAVGLMQVGDRVSLSVVRKGWLGATEKLTVNAKLAGEIATSARSSELTNPRLGGASFEEIPRDAPAYGEVQGVLVREVERGSRAWLNGLRPGDIIMSVNQRPVSHPKNFLELVNKEESALLLHVLRGNSAAYMVAK
ncbi:MAG: DegQ family serine endoprotease [Gammaproteobacteria bacterium]